MIHNISRFIAALALLATAQGAWAEWTGTGTSADPYIISTPEDLLLLAHRVNGTSGETVNTYQGKFFKLGANITFAPDNLTLDEGQSNYEAIGHYDGIHEFKGNFNGDGYTVSGIRINKTGSGNAYNCQGLFGLIASGAEIHDVHLTDARITGYDYVAGIVAYNFGTVSGCTVTDSYITYNAFDHGTICACNGGTLTNNYYHGCTVNGTAVTSGKGCGGSDLAANNGALPAYAITFGDGVSTTALASAPENGFVYNGVSYYRKGLALPLASTFASEVPEGYTLFSANGTAFSGSDYTVSATDGDVTITTATTISIDPAQFSVNDAGTEYTIHTAGGWNVFCDLLADNAMGYFSGKTVELGADITVTRMAGGSSHDFTGTFDGDSHTLTLNYTTTEEKAAPFRNVESGCVIQNLHVAGTINTSAKNAAGLVGTQYGAVTIRNCRVSVTIQSTVSGDGTHGGLVATNGNGSGSSLTIEGCVFDGSLLGSTTNKCGGFIGWQGKTATITNSLFAPAEVTVLNEGSATFARNGVDTYNCYYTTLLNDGTNYVPAYVGGTETPNLWHNGKATRTVAAGTDVTIKAIALTGDATQYTVSGITAYSGGGLQRGQTLYYGSGDQLSLTLSKSATGAPRGYRYDGYTASAGTLSGTTLTMPDEDVTISVALAPIDWATVDKGDSKYPYMIYNKDQLLLLAHRVNGTNGETANDYQGKYFKLGADITFDPNVLTLDEGQSNYEAIGGYIGGYTRNFNGNFDGDGHTVSGIRICKDGTDDADSNQGLFGQIGSHANIHDVHLTDARIKGYYYVGGIVGFNTDNSIVSGCTVTNSHITATGEYGTICGFNAYGTLRNNYYHGCTVNSTAVTSGKGCEGADIADDNGALPAYAITLGDGVSTTVLASEPENGFVKGGISYYRLGLALPLASEAPEGYTLSFSAKGTALSGSTYTVNATDGDVTINATLLSDGLEHEVNYMTADGTTQTAKAIALDGHEAAVKEYGIYRIHLAAGTYYVGTDITYANQIVPDGDITLILANGKTMTLASDVTGIEGDYDLTIYGQSLDAATAGTLRYDGTSRGIYVINYVQHSGNVSITTNGSAVNGNVADVTLRGGTLTISANGDDARAISGRTHSILGGHLTATGATGIYASGSSGITLGWTNPADFITASSYYASGTVKVADGQALTDGSGNIYTGTLTTADLTAIGGQTLRPCLALADAADNTAAIDDHASQTLAVALSGRTLYKDGSWNTLCLPFSVSTASGTLSGDGVQAMTLNTTTSNLADGTLTLNFTAATTIPAGTPFIIKWDNTGVNITNPVFMGVTVSNTTNDATVEGVLTFTGTYAPVTTPAGGDNTKLYLGAANKLYYPKKAMTIGTHRAYFQLSDGITAAEPTSPQQAGVRAFVLNFGDDEATGIISVHDSGFMVNGSNAWYTLDGRRLDGQPTAKGLYIHQGKKVAIK